MPVTQTDASAQHSSLVPPVDPGALVSKPSPRKEPAQPPQVNPEGAREPFDFSEYIEFLQYAEWGWF